MNLMENAREIGLDLIALVWPTACVACGVPDRDCCTACLAEVRATGPVVQRDIGVPCFAAGPYEGAPRALLIEFKHAGRIGFARDLGPRLRAPLAAALRLARGPLAPIIATAPSRASRVRQRGYRHVEMLVTSALREREQEREQDQRLRVLRARPLVARRGRVAQLGLDAAERERNARRVAVRASCRNLLAGRDAIIVDDVVTTGATIRAAAGALEAAGARVAAAAALCAVARRDEQRLNS